MPALYLLVSVNTNVIDNNFGHVVVVEVLVYGEVLEGHLEVLHCRETDGPRTVRPGHVPLAQPHLRDRVGERLQQQNI